MSDVHVNEVLHLTSSETSVVCKENICAVH